MLIKLLTYVYLLRPEDGYFELLFDIFVQTLLAVQLWYNEKQHYDYETTKCAAGKVCGHYTTVVWSTSRHVGCAYRYCTPLASFGNGKNRGSVLVCNYFMYRTVYKLIDHPYKKGPACSRCGSGAGWCKDKLCNRECSGPGKDCSCAVHCHNCATVNQKTCQCSCAKGWLGAWCHLPCEDNKKYCTKWKSKSPKWCQLKQVWQNCPAWCKVCTPDPDAKAGDCPIAYGPDAYKSTASTMSVLLQQHMMMMMVTMIITQNYNRL